MAQILAASPTCQMRVPKHSSSVIASSKLWSSVVLKQKKQSSNKLRSFRVFALQSDNSTVNRVESLLNLDTKPYTDRIIAEYIWYYIYIIQTLLNFFFSFRFMWIFLNSLLFYRIGGSGIDLRSKSRVWWYSLILLVKSCVRSYATNKSQWMVSDSWKTCGRSFWTS